MRDVKCCAWFRAECETYVCWNEVWGLGILARPTFAGMQKRRFDEKRPRV